MSARTNWRTDLHLGAAVMAAPVVWGLLIGVFDRRPDFSWPLVAPWAFAMLVLIRPLFEEIVFRGLIQGWLLKQQWGGAACFGITSANALTTALFTLLHLFAHPPLMALLIFLPSLVFGHLRERYDGWLLPSIILHMFYNAGYFLLYPIY